MMLLVVLCLNNPARYSFDAKSVSVSDRIILNILREITCWLIHLSGDM